jgi:hypothetical protein
LQSIIIFLSTDGANFSLSTSYSGSILSKTGEGPENIVVDSQWVPKAEGAPVKDVGVKGDKPG